MPIELKPSSICSDVRCAVCGQGFLLFSNRLAHLYHHRVQAYVQHELRQQHTTRDDRTAHPAEGFTLELDAAVPAAA